MNLVAIGFFVLGLVVLSVGAEVFVRGASRLAAIAGIPPLVIGLTVVGFGTSAPEVAVSVQSALSGQGDLAIGNVVGSNIANVLLVLGVSAAIAPLIVSQQLVRFDVPLMIGVSLLLLCVSLDGTVGRLDGVLFVAGSVAYTGFLIVQSRSESAMVQAEYAREFGSKPLASRGQKVWSIVYIAGGLVLLILGADWLVESAVSFAQALGVSELVIGLTIVAVGTSLPEAATSVVASLRGERDIAVGNVVGSCIFNVLVVLGVSSIVAPAGIHVAPAALRFDLPVMLAVAVACLPIFFTGHLIARWEGFVFVGYYVAYLLYLILKSTQHQSLPYFSNVMVLFVLPLTVVTLGVVTWRAIHRGNPT